MYDFEQDYENDNEWKEFLSEFMMPATSAAEEDDEKSDPEYVAAEPASMDKDELKPFKVSKRELNQLIAELLEDSANNFNFDQEPSTSTKRSSTDVQANKNKRQKLTSPTNSKPQSPKISSKMYSSQEVLSTPPHPVIETSTSASSISDQEIQPSNPEELNSFYQQQMMTPQKATFLSPNLIPSPNLFSSPPLIPIQTPASIGDARLPQITGVYGSAPSTTNALESPLILIRNAQNQLELTSSFNLINQAFCNNGIIQLPQFQQIVLQVPTIDLLQNRLNFNPIVAQPLASSFNTSSIELDTQNLDHDKKKRLSSQNDKLKEFENLEDEQLSLVETSFKKDMTGFTSDQISIYEQQMRTHAQLLSQHYVQTYANPKWWTKSEGLKQNLLELKKVVNPEFSPMTAEHIGHCLTLCEDWEKELEENNERNKKYAEFLYDEYDHDVKAHENSFSFKGRFHNRLMEHLLSSKAILYPRLLPKVPFRVVEFHQVDPPNSELRLLAFGIERFSVELYNQLNDKNPYKIRNPKTTSIARSIIREYKSFRHDKGLVKIIERLKNYPSQNPIKYYYTHKKAPKFKHEIEEIDKFIAPKNLRRGLLPKNWDAYMFSYTRVS